jgi:hypothetical protein
MGPLDMWRAVEIEASALSLSMPGPRGLKISGKENGWKSTSFGNKQTFKSVKNKFCGS